MKPYTPPVSLLISLAVLVGCQHPISGPPSRRLPDAGAALGSPGRMDEDAAPRTGVAFGITPSAPQPRRIQAWAADIETYRLKLKSSLLPDGELSLAIAATEVRSVDGAAHFSVRNLLPTESGTPDSLYDVYVQVIDRGGNVVNTRNDEAGFALVAADVSVIAYEMTEIPPVSLMLLPNFAPHPASIQTKSGSPQQAAPPADELAP